MDIVKIKHDLEKSPNLATALGIELISTEDDKSCVAKMKVDERTRQPFGYLSGGASLALAETLAGAGSYCLCPDSICVGVNVSGTHIKPVPEGEMVTAIANIQHQGKKVHHWQVTVRDESGETVSNIQVTNYIIQKQMP